MSARHEGDSGLNHAGDHGCGQALEQGNAFAQCGLEIQLAIHCAGGDACDMGPDARLIGQFVNAFLLDHRAVHIGEQELFATVCGGLDNEVDAEGLQAFPSLPAVFGHRLQREFRGNAGVQPSRIAPTPSVTQAFHRLAVQRGGGGVCQQGGDEHGGDPLVCDVFWRRRFLQLERRFRPIFPLVPDRAEEYVRRWDTPPQRGAYICEDNIMTTTTPAVRPANPRFSSGPCAKIPNYSLDMLADAPLGRSHRAAVGKSKLAEAIDLTAEILGLPEGYRVGIVPGSDTGAVEMAMWSLLGARPVEMLAWESFGEGWVTDAVKQLKLDATVRKAPYGEIVDLTEVDFDKDVVFTWNGTTSGARLPNGDAIPADRAGLTICDATSAAFAMDLPWDKLDVVTFSWQKVLGGEGAHGVMILSPRAVERLETYTPAWPMPKIFRMTKGGKLIEGIFKGETINTPSMLAVEDYLVSLKWAKAIGGQKALIARAEANAAAVAAFVNATPWIENLAARPEIASTTSVCLKFTDARITDGAAFAKAVAKRLEKAGVALDIGAYRDAPPGLRIWCGSTVETSDVEALMPWIDWAFQAEIAELAAAA